MGFAKAKREEPSSWCVHPVCAQCFNRNSLQLEAHAHFSMRFSRLLLIQRVGELTLAANLCYACDRAGHSICAHTPVDKLEWKSDARGAMIPYGDSCLR